MGCANVSSALLILVKYFTRRGARHRYLGQKKARRKNPAHPKTTYLNLEEVVSILPPSLIDGVLTMN